MSVKVSIICTAYNHEKYIRNTLMSFINQKTNFDFEVIVHDDASSDDTANIIREFHERFPNIIKPIYQSINQDSKGVKITRDIMLPVAQGKYIAICEGDDFWIDEYKLQAQFDYMESNPDCSFCFGNAIVFDVKNNKCKQSMLPQNCIDKKYFYDKDFDYNVGELALLGFIPTATFFIPIEIYRKVLDIDNSFNGDQKIKLYATSFGFAHYINKHFSQYNVNVSGSVTNLWRKLDKHQYEKKCLKFIDLTEDIDTFTDYKYHKELDILKDYYIKNILRKPYFGILKNNPDYRRVYKKLNLKQKLIFYFRLLFVK